MSKENAFIEILISSTEKETASWEIYEELDNSYLRSVYNGQSAIVCDIDSNRIVLIKYGGSSYEEERVDLILFKGTGENQKPALSIEQGDLEKPHRLWTLYKLADRNATGADKIMDDIISKLSDNLPF